MKCGNTSCDKDGTSRCAACKSVYYCSQPCQKQAWKAHKPECKRLQSLSHEAHTAKMPSALDTLKTKDLKGLNSLLSSFSLGVKTDEYSDVHKEYRARYPKDPFNIKILEKHCHGYKFTRMHPSVLNDMNISLMAFGSKEQILRKRWGHMAPNLLMYLSEAKVGDIYLANFFTEKEDNIQYLTQFDRRYHIMRNTAVRSMTTHVGKVYVSVGFVDLQEVMFSDISDPAIEGNVSWHCYEANEVAFARAKIILELFKTDICSDEDILQIWYSTSLERSAQIALQTTCKQLATDTSLSPRLKILFSFWGSTGLSTQDARMDWTKYIHNAAMDKIYALENITDRVDYARYLLTGEVFLRPDARKTFGNVTMSCMPKGFEHFRRDQHNIFHTLVLQNMTYESSLMGTVRKLFTAKANKFRRFVLDGKIIVKLYQKTVHNADFKILKQIKGLNPAMINWSNLPDYLRQKDFFETAQACSGAKTQHHFHLMNWVCKVYGCSLIDYVRFDLREFLDSSHLPFSDRDGKLEKVYKSLADEFRVKMVQEVKDTLKSFQINPILPNEMNTAGSVLAPKMLPHFKNFFFGWSEMVEMIAGIKLPKASSIPSLDEIHFSELTMSPFSPFSLGDTECCGVFQFNE